MLKALENKIFKVDATTFEEVALEIFQYQVQHNAIYNQFAGLLKIVPSEVKKITQIPFLPVSLFKTHKIVTSAYKTDIIFESSGTTGSVSSKHYVPLPLYEKSFTKGLELFYGDLKDWCIIGLLPSYLERNHSSLVYMVNYLIKNSNDDKSGFFLHDHKRLSALLAANEMEGKRTLLIGVTYALLDFATEFTMQLKKTIVMETGGMKGRRKELTRQEVHHQLKKRLGVAEVHSEYGMTELLSQAYSQDKGEFDSPPWMKIMARSEDDPMEVNVATEKQVNGVANIIDLANLNSCSFIATDDMVKLFPNGKFEILGRIDNSDVRGCSLMLNNLQ